MNIFISKYKVLVNKIESIDDGIIVCKGVSVPLDAGTPFKIFLMEEFSFCLVTLDGKHTVRPNADIFKLGFTESEFLPELNVGEKV